VWHEECDLVLAMDSTNLADLSLLREVPEGDPGRLLTAARPTRGCAVTGRHTLGVSAAWPAARLLRTFQEER